ncbi:MAG: nucleotidyltransferase domain-containing protein [Thermaerobacter sp.]|nr:nucleotidyltransferase domain-containing protein [Thermaerobacter sp.]
MVSCFAEAAAAIRSAIQDKYPQVSRAYIFGSFASGANVDDSDLDVLVETSAPMGLSFLALILDIEVAAGLAVDVITARQAETLESRFGYDIAKGARIVYERPPS